MVSTDGFVNTFKGLAEALGLQITENYSRNNSPRQLELAG